MFFAKRLCTIPSCFLKGFEKSRGLRRLNLMAKMNLRKFQIWKWKLAAVLCSSLCSLFYLCCANSEWKENSTRIKAVLVHTKNTTNQACYLKGEHMSTHYRCSLQPICPKIYFLRKCQCHSKTTQCILASFSFLKKIYLLICFPRKGFPV